MTNNPNLIKCNAFNNKGEPCQKCSHDFTVHMHITYTTTIVEEKFLAEDSQRLINEKGSEKEKKEEFLKQLETKIVELEKERMMIMESAAKFAIFMKENALIPFNDSFDEYLDMLITDERNKSVEIRDKQKIEILFENKRIYGEQIKALKHAISSGSNKDFGVKDVYEAKTRLMRLKHYGKKLKVTLGIKLTFNK